MRNGPTKITLYTAQEPAFLSMIFNCIESASLLLVDSFIESFPYRQVSQVEWGMEKVGRTEQEVTQNIVSDTPFILEYGSWFVCSENPLRLKFEEYNKLLGYKADIPIAGPKLLSWAAKVLESTRVTCFSTLDVDCTELTVFFTPENIKTIQSHIEPILNSHSLKLIIVGPES
ncbi:MAG: hypothetical protein JW860_05905 [Sedimentisphaerales bacterium]|nr:hypothetical protein [Sedimentisphaerales bacterium]